MCVCNAYSESNQEDESKVGNEYVMCINKILCDVIYIYIYVIFVASSIAQKRIHQIAEIPCFNPKLFNVYATLHVLNYMCYTVNSAFGTA